MADKTPIGRHIPYPARGMYYPAWAPDFTGLDALEILDHDGNNVINGETKEPVTLKDVAPERRWAIDFDTGKFMPQRDFMDLFRQWITLECTKGGRIVALTENNKYYMPELEPVPDVAEFVLRRPDGGQITWRDSHVGDFRPPQQAQNQELISQLVEGLGSAFSGFEQKPAQPATRQVAEKRQKFTTVPQPSDPGE